MSIQILGLRSFEKDSKNITHDAFHEENWRAPSVKMLFRNVEKYLEKIPDAERWNQFYTLANCTDAKREFRDQQVIAFDIDGIDTAPNLRLKYAEIICDVLGVAKEKTGIVGSGNGLHFIIELPEQLTITSSATFKELKPHYKKVCQMIDFALAEAGLPGNADPAIFEPRRLLRLPGTENRKEKGISQCVLFQHNLEPQPLDLKDLAKLPTISEADALSPGYLNKYPVNDPEAIFDQCQFMKWALHNPDKVSEEQWYAALSITSRMNNGRGKDGSYWSHKLSKGYSKYSADETEEKHNQALEASGPRTCKNLAAVGGKCKGCGYHGGKITSPILIKAKDTIATEHTGFHTLTYTKDGKPAKPKPCYTDLRKFFERDNAYVGIEDSRITMVWNGTHYEPWGNPSLEQFAQTHFDPPANNAMVKEFRELVSRTNLKKATWFDDSTKGLINFENGVLNINTMEIEPHSPERGFRYTLPYKYDPRAEAPRFERMMDLVTGKNYDIQNILLEFMGYSISGDDYWAHKCLVLEGTGSNGKSTFMNVLKHLAGDGNYSTLSLKDLSSEYNRQTLDGKLFNISEETPSKSLIDSSLFKIVSSGGEMMVRLPYKNPYNIRSRAKMIFACNEMPQTMDLSYGLFRRLLIIPFDQVITKDTVTDYDPYLEEKLREELPGIFNMAIAGYHRLKKQKAFSKSEAVENKIENYFQEINSVVRWVEDFVTFDNSDDFVSLADLYFSYEQECEQSGEKALTKIAFSKELGKHITDYKQRSVRKYIDGRRHRGLQGVKLESASESDSPQTTNLVSIRPFIQ